MTEPRRGAAGWLGSVAGKLRWHKRQAPDPDSLLVEQQQHDRDPFHDRWGSYGGPIESPQQSGGSSPFG